MFFLAVGFIHNALFQLLYKRRHSVTWPILNAATTKTKPSQAKQIQPKNSTLKAAKLLEARVSFCLDYSKGKSFVENCDCFPRQRYILVCTVHAFTCHHSLSNIRFYYFTTLCATSSSTLFFVKRTAHAERWRWLIVLLSFRKQIAQYTFGDYPAEKSCRKYCSVSRMASNKKRDELTKISLYDE